MPKSNKPKLLFLDIETAPIVGYAWGLFDQNIALNQIAHDWSVLSWAAKWQGEKKVMYEDQRKAKNVRDDKKLLKGIWKLLDEADVIVTQNGVAFDIKKLNARFIQHGFKPPSPFQQIDTLKLAKKNFAFTSNKLEYLTSKLNKNEKKSSHKNFPGFELWRECLAGNKSAWKEMEVYNKRDVTSLEELYNTLIVWGSPVNFTAFDERAELICQCGSHKFHKDGTRVLKGGRFQRFRCNNCGAIHTIKIKKKAIKP